MLPSLGEGPPHPMAVLPPTAPAFASWLEGLGMSLIRWPSLSLASGLAEGGVLLHAGLVSAGSLGCSPLLV